MKIGWMLLMASVAAVGLAGCHSRTNLDYVIEHSCVSDGEIQVIGPITAVMDGRVQTITDIGKPYYIYRCPDGVSVFIDSDQPQHFVSKPAASLKQEPR